MISYYARKEKTFENIGELYASSWVNIQPPYDHAEIEILANKLSIPLDFLTDSLDIDERSRYELEDDIRLIVINTPILNEEGKKSEGFYYTAPIGIILTTDHILTITSIKNPIIEKFLQGRVKNFNPNDHKEFVLLLFEQTVFRFLDCIKKLNLKRNLIEQELYDSSRNKELQQLLRIEKSLVYFVNSLSSNELLKMKMKRTDFLKIRDNERYTDLFEDIIIDNSQALEMSNVYTNILSSTMEAYASIISNNLNVFIQRLTIVTIILMVPTLVASFYGMNLEHLPFVDSKYAFPIIIMFSVVLGFLLILFFRRGRMFK